MCRHSLVPSGSLRLSTGHALEPQANREKLKARQTFGSHSAVTFFAHARVPRICTERSRVRSEPVFSSSLVTLLFPPTGQTPRPSANNGDWWGTGGRPGWHPPSGSPLALPRSPCRLSPRPPDERVVREAAGGRWRRGGAAPHPPTPTSAPRCQQGQPASVPHGAGPLRQGHERRRRRAWRVERPPPGR